MNCWMCDRCKATSNLGDVDDPPPNWRFTPMPVRGSQGARSTRDAVICDDCDDSLYQWVTTPDNVESTIQPEPLEWPHSYTYQQCYDLGAERMRAAIQNVEEPA